MIEMGLKGYTMGKRLGPPLHPTKHRSAARGGRVRITDPPPDPLPGEDGQVCTDRAHSCPSEPCSLASYEPPGSPTCGRMIFPGPPPWPQPEPMQMCPSSPGHPQVYRHGCGPAGPLCSDHCDMVSQANRLLRQCAG